MELELLFDTAMKANLEQLALGFRLTDDENKETQIDKHVLKLIYFIFPEKHKEYWSYYKEKCFNTKYQKKDLP